LVATRLTGGFFPKCAPMANPWQESPAARCFGRVRRKSGDLHLCDVVTGREPTTPSSRTRVFPMIRADAGLAETVIISLNSHQQHGENRRPPWFQVSFREARKLLLYTINGL